MDFFSRRFGPLPLWGYALGALGAVVFLRWRAAQAPQGAPSQIPIAAGDMSVLPQEGTPLGFFDLPIGDLPLSAQSTTSNQSAKSSSSAPNSFTANPNLLYGTGLVSLPAGSPPGLKRPL